MLVLPSADLRFPGLEAERARVNIKGKSAFNGIVAHHFRPAFRPHLTHMSSLRLPRKAAYLMSVRLIPPRWDPRGKNGEWEAYGIK
jgi:hypothetical protein